jgi:hypothetical protein
MPSHRLAKTGCLCHPMWTVERSSARELSHEISQRNATHMQQPTDTIKALEVKPPARTANTVAHVASTHVFCVEDESWTPAHSVRRWSVVGGRWSQKHHGNFLRLGKRVDDERTTSLTSSPCVEFEAVEYTTQETTTVSFMTGHGPKRNFERVQGSWLVGGWCGASLLCLS